MSVVNAFVQRKAAYLLTDMAMTDMATGQLLAVGSKFIRGFEPFPWGVAVTGNVMPGAVLHAIERLNPVTPTRMFERLPEIVSIAAELAEREFAALGLTVQPQLAVAIAMWSRKHNAPAVACCDLDGSIYGSMGPHLTPYEVEAIIAGGDDVHQSLEGFLGRPANACDPKSFDPERDGLALVSAQRERLKWSCAPGTADAHRAGGGVQLMRVGKRGVSIRTLHIWDEDCVGELIQP